MSKKQTPDPEALLENASTAAPEPVPPVVYSLATRTAITLLERAFDNQKEITDLEEFREERAREYEHRSDDCDLRDQKQVAGLTILSTQLSAATDRLSRRKEDHEQFRTLLTNACITAHGEACGASERRAHYKIADLQAQGKTREEAIQGRSGDLIRNEHSAFASKPSIGVNFLQDAKRTVDAIRVVYDELNELQHAHGQITIDRQRDFLRNDDPVQKPRGYRW